VVAVVVASLFAVPAALALLGRRVDALDARVAVRSVIGRPPRAKRPEDTGLLYRIVTWVTRFPGLSAVATILVLLLLGAPFLSVKFGYSDDRVIGSDAQSRQVGDVIRDDFAFNATTPLLAVLPDYSGSAAQIAAYAKKLSLVEGVVMVSSPAGAFAHGTPVGPPATQMSTPAATVLTIGSHVDPFSHAGDQQLTALRAVDRPGYTMFAGKAAFNADSLQSLQSRLPFALALIALATYVALFVFTGSAVLPLKALVLNTLSLCATFGAMVWIFQEGHLSNLLGFTATGYLPPPMPILMFCLAFGISMDYEVFILARVREEWLGSVGTSADNTRAIALGVARTGRVITAAAALMAVVFSAIVSSRVSFMQMFGLGVTLMVIVDTVFVRLILAPAFMQLMGRMNWWAPKPMRRMTPAVEVTGSPSR
jgi:RND superfamily putative drug exporter